MDYVITKDTNIDELQHYGVVGMKWGVRRAQRMYAKATTNEGKAKAVSLLKKHKAKATKKVEKLNKKHVNLQKSVDRHIQKTDLKSASYRSLAAKERNKAYGLFTSERRSQKHQAKAAKYERKAYTLEARSRKAKAYLAKNEKQAELFNSGISSIDSTLAKAGRKYING